jgi:hypothetical protein
MRQWVPPGCSFGSKAASDRTRAEVQGVLEAQGKWSWGSGTGPAFLLKAEKGKSPCVTITNTQGPQDRVPPPPVCKVPKSSPLPHFSGP